jgi:hypothetical protein
MAYEVKDLTGTLFRNDRKTSEKHPDKKGSCKINGQEYWVSGWIRYSDNGEERISLAFSLKEERSDRSGPATVRTNTESAKPHIDINDDIPF